VVRHVGAGSGDGACRTIVYDDTTVSDAVLTVALERIIEDATRPDQEVAHQGRVLRRTMDVHTRVALFFVKWDDTVRANPDHAKLVLGPGKERFAVEALTDKLWRTPFGLWLGGVSRPLDTAAHVSHGSSRSAWCVQHVD
jgi:hypothetical protein